MENNLVSWNQPGGKLGKNLLWVLGLGALGVSWMTRAAILAFCTDIFKIGIIGVVSFLIYWIFSNPVTRDAMKYLYLDFCRKLVYKYVHPLTILEDQLHSMRDLYEEIITQITNIKKTKVNMEKRLKELQNTAEKCKRTIESANKMLATNLSKEDYRSYNKALIKARNNLVTATNSIEEQNRRVELTSKYLDVLENIGDKAEISIDNAANALKTKKEDYAQAQAINAATYAMKRLLGNSNNTIFQDDAIDKINETVSLSIAEMQNLLDGSNDLLVNYNLESISNASKAEEILNNFQTKEITYLESPVLVPVERTTERKYF